MLLKASREHAQAIYAALRAVHGIEIPAGDVEAAGLTDGAIARAILTMAGVPEDEIGARWAEVAALAVEEFDRRCPADLSAHVAPGVPEVLAGLAGRGDVRLSLLTGNLEAVARLKLDRAGIGRWFPAGQGAFGSDHDDRAALPPIARARAGGDGEPYPRERTVVIGDTPRDIACARADGVHVIAVATGPYAADDLGDADAVVEHAAELPDALARLAARAAQP